MGGNEQNRMEVILEDINGKFDLVLEGHATLEQMIRNHQTETRQDKQELQALIKTSHDTLDAKIDATADRLDAKIDATADLLDAKIDSVAADLNTKIDDVATSLSVEIQSVGEKVDGHEARITVLERKVA